MVTGDQGSGIFKINGHSQRLNRHGRKRNPNQKGRAGNDSITGRLFISNGVLSLVENPSWNREPIDTC